MSLIAQSTIERVIDEAEILTVVQMYPEIVLTKKGQNWQGLSPFQTEKSPSFFVNETKGIFKCYASGKGGGPVRFLMEYKGMSYPEAIKILAEKYHIPVEFESFMDPEETARIAAKRKTYSEIMDMAVKKYAANFQRLKSDHPAKVHVYEYRNLTEEEAIQWQIGYCPKGSFLRQDFVELGLMEAATELFLVNGDSSKPYDKLQNRIIFPLQDANHNYIGLAGRAMLPDQKPKFINPTDNPLYKKKDSLYGLNFASKSIRERKKAYLVEGYNDVIAFHKNGIENTIGCCGTSITSEQLKLLRRHTDELVIVFDSDAAKPTNAGEKRAFEQIDLCISSGFKVSIVILPYGEDPDSLTRGLYAETVIKESLQGFLDGSEQDAIKYKAEFLMLQVSGVHQKAAAIQKIAETIGIVKSPITRTLYIDEISQKLEIPKKDLKKSVDEIASKYSQDDPKNKFKQYEDIRKDDYTLPTSVGKDAWDQVSGDILKYGMFFYNNTLYSRRKGKEKWYFDEIANFRIKVIQHMEDDKNPRKLVELVNSDNRRRVFDTKSEDFITPVAMRKMLTNQGNFNWQGNDSDFVQLNTKLMNEMGDGRMINQLGWQPEGFWAFNNAVIIDSTVYYLDENGCFDFKDSNYYLPSGNPLYKFKPQIFASQKKLIFKKASVPLPQFLKLLRSVHREHSFNAILHTMATIFSDIVFDKQSFFPMMYLYGEASTGKDNLIETCQSLFGKPQDPVTITGKANTDKGKIRKFAEFRNMIVHMSEYVSGNPDTDEMCKGFWGRMGYTRGNIDSSYGTEQVPIECSAWLTGNDYPNNDALITRLICEDMLKNTFSAEEREKYNELKSLSKEGLSGYLPEILRCRLKFATDFNHHFEAVTKELKSEIRLLTVVERMIANVAVCGATYRILSDSIEFPFTWEEWKEHTIESLIRQNNKRTTGSVISKFWDCFLAGTKDRLDPLTNGKDFKLDNGIIWFNFKSAFIKYSTVHYSLFREKGLSQSILVDKLKKAEGFKEIKDSVRFGAAGKSSAYGFDIKKTGIQQELENVLEMHNEPNLPKEAKNYLPSEEKTLKEPAF